MVIINNKTASATFVGSISIIPGAHSYDVTAEQLEKIKQNELFAHRVSRDEFIVEMIEDGIPSGKNLDEIIPDASAKELEELVAKITAARAKSVAAAEAAEGEQDPEKKEKAIEAAGKAAKALEALEKALDKRRAEVEKKRSEIEKANGGAI